MQELGLANGICLASTFGCGQSFRWQPCAEREGAWQGVADGRFSTIWVEQDRLYADCAPSDVDFWRSYLCLDLDYALLQQQFAADEKLAACVAAAPGIRVLRQPFFETLCTFIISQNNNIPRITGIVSRLCALCGTELAPGCYAFPTARQLAARTEGDLLSLRAGWRTAYLLDAAAKVSDGLITEAGLRSADVAQARSLLQSIRGVGPKVADCTLLYGLGRWSACPMDVWMKRAMRALFPQGMPACAAGYEGIAQQYIFAWARENLSAKADFCSSQPLS